MVGHRDYVSVYDHHTIVEPSQLISEPFTELYALFSNRLWLTFYLSCANSSLGLVILQDVYLSNGYQRTVRFFDLRTGTCVFSELIDQDPRSTFFKMTDSMYFLPCISHHIENSLYCRWAYSLQ